MGRKRFQNQNEKTDNDYTLLGDFSDIHGLIPPPGCIVASPACSHRKRQPTEKAVGWFLVFKQIFVKYAWDVGKIINLI